MAKAEPADLLHDLPPLDTVEHALCRMAVATDLMLHEQLNGVAGGAVIRGCVEWVRLKKLDDRLKLFDRLVAALETLKRKDQKIAALLERLGLNGQS